MKVNFSTEDIVEIHDELIKELGGDAGNISLSSIEFILDHAKNNKFNEDFFTILSKILQAITIDHPFVDGNKRTGIVVIQSILQDNGLILSISEKEKEEFILNVASLKLSLDDIKYFLENNSEIF